LFLKKVQKVQTLWVASIFFFLELVSGWVVNSRSVWTYTIYCE
jgi:hypothetical protein